MRRKVKRNKQITRSTKVQYQGLNFASKLEMHMYKLLKQAKIPVEYEGKTFSLVEGFDFTNASYEKTRVKKFLHDRGNKNVLPIKYTPDFLDIQDPPRFIIECKGNPNEAFPIRWKLFKRYLINNNIKADLFMPRNQKDCAEVVKIIQEIID
tara:strand:+ start:32914 stop:33369 length:456 start_codon:yes stop_codon:yes gene_type:complete